MLANIARTSASGLSIASAMIPDGMILPFMGTSVPSGFTEVTAARDRYLIGASTLSGGGVSAGSFSISMSATLPTAGAHTGTAFTTFGGTPAQGGTANQRPLNSGHSDGAHTHSVSVQSTDFTNHAPYYRSFIFIKANSSVPIPTESCLFGVPSSPGSGVRKSAPPGFTEWIETADVRYIRGGTTALAFGGVESIAWTYFSSTGGSHVHSTQTGTLQTGSSVAGYTQEPSTGSHDHSGTAQVQNMRLKSRSLQVFKVNEIVSSLSGMIGLWDQPTLPTGWVFCDGTNGTPDMRGYHVSVTITGFSNPGEVTTSANQFTGTFGSSNTAVISHTHRSTSTTTRSETTNNQISHTSYSWSHSHGSVSGSGTLAVPTYALSFVMAV